MFDSRSILSAARCCLVAVSLALLAACGGGGGSSGIDTPPPPAATAPQTPANLAATAGDGQASLSWSASSGATSYAVKRSQTSGGPYTQVATPSTVTYSETSLTNGTMYYYVVSAKNSAGESANSAEVGVKPVAVIPTTPTGVTANAGNAQVALQWTASAGASSYHVKRSTVSSGPYTQINAPTSSSYTDSAVINGTTYYYVVSAVSSAGESADSAPLAALPADPNLAPPPTTFGTWTNVTPAGINLTSALSCGNYGTQSAQVDPAHPSDIYTMFMCQGVYKSTDYGATWNGPINTGTNGALITDCAGGITIGTNSSASTPTLYAACIRGTGIGFWISTDGGVNWTQSVVAPGPTQDFYTAVVDPYDPNHLLMAAHERNLLVESTDGGQNWASVALDAGMMENGGTGEIFFINNGTAGGTRGLWLWIAQESGGNYGTWRTADSGAHWTKVDKNEHSHGSSQIYQPDNNGVVYMAGSYSASGNGVLRSTDYGQTWSHVGSTASGETVVIGTSKNVYAMYGWAIGIGGTINAAFEIATEPGNGTWASKDVPSGLSQGAAQLAVVNDGTHNIIVGAMWNGGLWRYVEP